MRKATFYNAKGHISRSNMCPFALQFAAYRNVLKNVLHKCLRQDFPAIKPVSMPQDCYRMYQS